MNLLGWVILFLFAWHLVGVIVLTTIDRDGRLLAWVNTAPYGLDMLALTLWPYLFYRYLRSKHERS